MGDPDENIEITSSEETMQIELKGNHHKHILHEICKKLDDLDVELDDLHVDHIQENNIKTLQKDFASYYEKFTIDF